MKPQCPHCAGNPVPHTSERISALMQVTLAPMHTFFDRITGRMGNLFGHKAMDRIGFWFLHLLAHLELGRIYDAPDAKNSHRTEVIWEEAKKRGIRMLEFRMFDVPVEQFMCEYKGDRRCFDSLPRPQGANSHSMAWMDDKATMRREFNKRGLPIALGGQSGDIDDALLLFAKLAKPVIVKPSMGSRSRHTTIHISDEAEFREAFRIAQQLSPWVIVEEELEGMVFRGTVIGGKVVAVMRREPPYVVGDGTKTVRQLLDIENARPERHGLIFHEIKIDVDVEKELSRQNLKWDSIPLAGVLVILHPKVGRGTGGGTTDVTDITHPETIAHLEKVAEVLADPLVGIDFIISDIAKSWSAQPRSGIIECNGLPFIDLHHFPLNGNPRNVAAKLWDIVYPNSK